MACRPCASVSADRKVCEVIASTVATVFFTRWCSSSSSSSSAQAAAPSAPASAASGTQAASPAGTAPGTDVGLTATTIKVGLIADVNNALFSIKQTTIKLRLQREVVTSSRRAFQLAEQQLKAGTADIVTVLNTQLTLFQAEDSLWQAELARLLAYVSLYQALGGGWEPRIERPANAL